MQPFEDLNKRQNHIKERQVGSHSDSFLNHILELKQKSAFLIARLGSC